MVNVAKSEGGHTSLRQCSIVENLVIDVLDSDHLAHMCFLQQVLGIIYSVVNSMMIGLVKCGSNTHSCSAMKVHLVDEL